MLEQKYISTDTIYWVKERHFGDSHVKVSALAFLHHLFSLKTLILTYCPASTLVFFETSLYSHFFTYCFGFLVSNRGPLSRCCSASINLTF